MRAWMLVLLALLAGGVTARDAGLPPGVSLDNRAYNGRFTFVRIRYEPSRSGPGNYLWGLDLKWNHDYPRAETHLMKILRETTTLDPNMAGGNVLALDDPELFKYPVAYLCEPGFWTPSEAESTSLRTYLLKGGFLIVDDFAGRQWDNFEAQMHRVLPGSRLLELAATHPVFDSFFRVDPSGFHHPYFRGFPSRFLGVFEDNDPEKRLLVVVNYNQDLSEYWEWSDTGFVPIELSNEAYKLGVDYVIYGMTH